MATKKPSLGTSSAPESESPGEYSLLSGGAVFHISWNLRENEATPEEAEAFWRHFCVLVDQGQPVLNIMLGNVRDALRRHFDEGANLKTAFGLTHKRGPRVSEEERQTIAADVLRYRLLGDSLEVAAEKVVGERGRSESFVRGCWSDNKQNALNLLRLERVVDTKSPWTASELDRIREIYVNEMKAPGEQDLNRWLIMKSPEG